MGTDRKARSIYPSDLLVGGVGGLAGYFFGFSRELTVMVVVVGSTIQFGAPYAWRRWKASRGETG